MNSAITLLGKVALITGGTSGIGRETALAFARAGAKLVVTGRREAEGAETVRLVHEADGQAHFVRTDVRNEEDLKAAVAETVSRYGRLDIAVNNAGVEAGGMIPEIDHETYRHVFDINVWGVIASMKYEIPAMLEGGGGSIINVSSVVGKVGMPGAAVYIASKHAVEGLTKVAALEYAAQGIRVNAIAPALIDTDMADRFAGPEGSEGRSQIAGLHPLGRTGKPAEVAAGMVFLASDAASFITGHSLGIDGGWLAR